MPRKAIQNCGHYASSSYKQTQVVKRQNSSTITKTKGCSSSTSFYGAPTAVYGQKSVQKMISQDYVNVLPPTSFKALCYNSQKASSSTSTKAHCKSNAKATATSTKSAARSSTKATSCCSTKTAARKSTKTATSQKANKTLIRQNTISMGPVKISSTKVKDSSGYEFSNTRIETDSWAGPTKIQTTDICLPSSKKQSKVLQKVVSMDSGGVSISQASYTNSWGINF